VVEVPEGAGGGILSNVEEMGDDVHVLGDLGENNHRLYLVVDLVLVFLQTREMRADLREGREQDGSPREW
jgi:hypothetical protein